MRYGFSSFKTAGFFNLLHLLVALLLSLSGASHAAAADEKSGLPLMFDDRERQSPPDMSAVLRVRILTTIDFPPFNFTDQNSRLSGFNVDLAREICTELKLEAKCQIQAVPYDQLETMLENGSGETVMAGLAVTPELRQRFLFSRPYLSIPARFVRNRAKPLSPDNATALSGRPVGVVAGTVHELMLKAFFPAITPTPFETDEAMLQAVKDGKVDAAFADGLRLPFWVASEASQNCCELFDGPYVSSRFLGEGMSVMVRKNDPLLATAMNQALAELSHNGRLEELYLRYFPNGLF